MRIRRRSLRKLLIAVGCVVGIVEAPEAPIGVFLLALGSGLHVWSKGCLEQNRRLTTAGPYRWTRNPFYLANAAIDLGFCFVIGRGWVAVVYLPIWWFSYRETIAREEAKLVELFPDAFAAYRAAVPRLIPTGRRLSRERAQGAFSWANPALARGSEYARVVGIALAALAIWAAARVRPDPLRIFESPESSTLTLLVFLGVGWILKLALAEVFRRPETALLPFASRPRWRIALGLGLSAVAMFLRMPWLTSLPVLWWGLFALDRVGAARGTAASPGERPLWGYWRPILLGTLAAVTGIAVLLGVCAG